MPPGKCPQCIAKTAKGEQCKRTTCRWTPFCASHKAYRVGQSTIPNAGRGAFAARDLKTGSTIGNYTIATVKQSPAEFKNDHPSGRATHTALVGNHYYTAKGVGNRTHNAIVFFKHGAFIGDAQQCSSARVWARGHDTWGQKGRQASTRLWRVVQNLTLTYKPI